MLRYFQNLIIYEISLNYSNLRNCVISFSIQAHPNRLLLWPSSRFHNFHVFGVTSSFPSHTLRLLEPSNGFMSCSWSIFGEINHRPLILEKLLKLKCIINSTHGAILALSRLYSWCYSRSRRRSHLTDTL